MTDYDDLYYDRMEIDAREAEEVDKHLEAGEDMCIVCGNWFNPDKLDLDNICEGCLI